MSYVKKIKHSIVLAVGIASLQPVLAEKSVRTNMCFIALDEAVGKTNEGQRLVALHKRKLEEVQTEKERLEKDVRSRQQQEQQGKIDLSAREELLARAQKLSAQEEENIRAREKDFKELTDSMRAAARQEAEKRGCHMVFPLEEHEDFISSEKLQPFDVTQQTIDALNGTPGRSSLPSLTESVVPKMCFFAIQKAADQTKEGQRVAALYKDREQKLRQEGAIVTASAAQYQEGEKSGKVDLKEKRRILAQGNLLATNWKKFSQEQAKDFQVLGETLRKTSRTIARKQGCDVLLPIEDKDALFEEKTKLFDVTLQTIASMDAGKAQPPEESNLPDEATQPQMCFLALDQAAEKSSKGKQLMKLYGSRQEQWRKGWQTFELATTSHEAHKKEGKVDLQQEENLLRERERLLAQKQEIHGSQISDFFVLGRMARETARAESKKRNCQVLLAVTSDTIVSPEVVKPLDVTERTVNVMNAGKGIMPAGLTFKETKDQSAKSSAKTASAKDN